MPGNLMSKSRHSGLYTGLLLALLTGFGGQAYADPNQVSYSPDHWPSRWSSAIRQQQTARFPTRDEVQAPPAGLPQAVFEQDLFYSPSMASRFERSDRRYNHARQAPAQRFSRHSGRYIRDAAFAYQNRFSAGPNNHTGSASMYPYGTSVPAMDPMPTFPGVGLPMMPGIPGAYPMNITQFGGMPFGHPGNMTQWYPPPGSW